MTILHNVHTINEGVKTIFIDHGLIHFAVDRTGNTSPAKVLHLHLDHCIAFPGLINSHDHLDFDLFPRLGNRIYNDYVEWGNDIHAVNKQLINPVLQVPRHLRVQWGMYKNLLAGITTVVHHGNYVEIQDPPIEVFQDCNMLHSIQLEKRWKLALNKPAPNKLPWVIHIGEGTNANARKEINSLIRWNLLKRKLIGIHGVAMNAKQAAAFEGLVWCPDSNFFLVGTTAAIDQLKETTRIVFGTDSTLSASWNIWEQLRMARKTALLTDEELFNAVTSSPAVLWNRQHTGLLKEGMHADIVIARPGGNQGSMAAFYSLNPEDILLVLKKGRIVLFDIALLDQLGFSAQEINDYSPVLMNHVCKYVIGNLPGLVHEIHQYAPGLAFPVKTA
jgi:cytosine/adenosine deaminase-related metal-dependent hydrolase